ncbi:hypothetical protein QBC47DRAFT_354353 [Echria macrotheca]|uniref:Uncharacterized protein n=1 Tax=Echria macrotheca TaxID=438768 RepID=A0AAJ0B482_9PEZI|nr:hypothetical protein QBC47DRAFT_354353 [Echria macrotheca]
MLSYRRLRVIYLLAAALHYQIALGQRQSKFSECKARLDGILAGTTEFNGITNATVDRYIYHGPIAGMKDGFAKTSRDQFIAITTDGCKAICEDPVDWYWDSDPDMTLGIISNWILPIIALLAALPYDSGRGGLRHVVRTLAEVRNWLGSPQTALTATFFSIHQMRRCRARARTVNQKDAYYVLYCIGQFELPLDSNCFLEALSYGLFRPIYEDPISIPAAHNRTAKRWSEELLYAMARQMRRSRRRGVWSMCASVFLFFVAFAVSVVLAFADLGERTTTHSLAFGILITWFPLLLFFSILDRNPNSAERTRTFIIRWLWSIRAVKKWENDRDRGSNLSDDAPPFWWSLDRDRRAPNRTPDHLCSHRGQCVPSHFIGQGRRIGYHGLAYSVTESVDRLETERNPAQPIKTIARNTRVQFGAKPPVSWLLSSLGALALVWLEIGMALMISYNIPTVGIGCRSGLYIIYGVFSTVPWAAHLFDCYIPKQGEVAKAVSRVLSWLSSLFLTLAVLCLVFITFAAFSGVLKNCTCRGGFGGYMDFETAEFYANPEHFDVKKWWIAAAVTAAVPVVLSFIVVLPIWVSLRKLWQEAGPRVGVDGEEGFRLLEVGEEGKADMDWVAY